MFEIVKNFLYPIVVVTIATFSRLQAGENESTIKILVSEATELVFDNLLYLFDIFFLCWSLIKMAVVGTVAVCVWQAYVSDTVS